MRPATRRNLTLLLLLSGCACAATGCSSLRIPRIDTTGERLFTPAPPDYQTEPRGQRTWDNVDLIVTPGETIAPVGSQVVLLAGVLGPDRYLTTNERVEWTVAPGGVGEIVRVGEGTFLDLLLLDWTRPRKVNNTFAIGSTSRGYTRLTRGSCATSDDVCVKAGQSWVVVSSPTEGTSYVTAYAPSVYGWDRQRRSATIYWVDAQWTFPPPAINPAGTRHLFTTTVSRHTNGAPCVGWLVRYEIAEGPPAGFAPDGSQVVEVVTDAQGQATVEIFQKQPTHGTNRIDIQVIRPATLPGFGGKRLLLGRGSTLKTWSAPQIAVRKTGPATVNVGGTFRYVIDVSNPGDLPAEGVVVVDHLPQGATYVDSTPPAQVGAGTLQWQLGQIAAGQTRRLEVQLRPGKLGTLTSCAEAVAAGGLQAKGCTTTQVTSPTLDLKITGPSRVQVGDRVKFEMVVTNRSAAAITGMTIRDTFGPGLKHKAATGAIDRPLDDLAPGASRRLHVVFTAVQAGRLCHTVEIYNAGGMLATQQACVEAVAATPSATQPKPTPKPASKPSLSVRKTAPATAVEGENVLFTIEVANRGAAALTGVRVVDSFDSQLVPVEATEGIKQDPQRGFLSTQIATIKPGEVVTLQVRCNCRRAGRACGRVSVTTAEGATGQAEACVEIRAAQKPQPPAGKPSAPAPGPPRLSVSIRDTSDPVNAGKTVTYSITIANNGQTADQNIRVVATVPPEMVVDPLGFQGPTEPSVSGRVVTFKPWTQIYPGEKRTYRVRALAKTAGSAKFSVKVTSKSLPNGTTAEETTLINPARQP